MLKLILGEPPNINKLMIKHLGEFSRKYDVHVKGVTYLNSVNLQQAKDYAEPYKIAGKSVTIVSSDNTPFYDDDLLTLMSDLNEYVNLHSHLYVLSREDGKYKAAYGDKGDCSENVDSNPAKALCLAFLKFKGEL